MVAPTKDQARAAFSKRLNEVLDGRGEVPKDRGRRTWVSKRYTVSIETARKWLMGLDLPDQTNLARICTDLSVSPAWLITGKGAKALDDADPLMHAMQGVWGELPSDDERKEVLNYARWRLDQSQGRHPEKPSTSPTIHPRPRRPI